MTQTPARPGSGDCPQLVVVGGPNGCGKTTFARHYADSESLPYLGADDIAFALAPRDPASVRVKAGREFSRRLADRCLLIFNGGESFLAVAESTRDEWIIYDEQMWSVFQTFVGVKADENGKA